MSNRDNLPFSASATGTTLATLIIAARQGRPLLKLFNATSDKAASVLTFYRPSLAPVPVVSQGGATSLTVSAANGTQLGSSGVILVAKQADRTLEYATISGEASGVLTVSSIATGRTAGDLIYKLEAVGTFPVGSGTVTQSNADLLVDMGAVPSLDFTGPALITLDGTSACAINLATGRYESGH